MAGLYARTFSRSAVIAARNPSERRYQFGRDTRPIAEQAPAFGSLVSHADTHPPFKRSHRHAVQFCRWRNPTQILA
jgi:hypothetical protein